MSEEELEEMKPKYKTTIYGEIIVNDLDRIMVAKSPKHTETVPFIFDFTSSQEAKEVQNTPNIVNELKKMFSKIPGFRPSDLTFYKLDENGNWVLDEDANRK